MSISSSSCSVGWCQDNGNRSNQESKFDFLATRQRLMKIDEGQQKIKIVRTNRQSNLRGSCQSIFSLCWHHPTCSGSLYLNSFCTSSFTSMGFTLAGKSSCSIGVSLLSNKVSNPKSLFRAKKPHTLLSFGLKAQQIHAFNNQSIVILEKLLYLLLMKHYRETVLQSYFFSQAYHRASNTSLGVFLTSIYFDKVCLLSAIFSSAVALP